MRQSSLLKYGTEVPSARAGAREWMICFLLFLATLLNYLDRQTLSVAAPLIRAEMKLDLSGLGYLFAAFYWSYTAGQIFAGLIIDRVNVRYAYAAAVAAWSLAGAAAALATGYWSLLVVRVLLGLCESANWPSALRVVSRIIPSDQRSLANGIFQSGTSIGALVAPPLVIAMATHMSWRVAFAVIGCTGLIWSLLWLVLFDDSGGETDDVVNAPSEGTESATEPEGTSPWVLTSSRQFWGLLLCSSFLNPCLYFYVNWLPTYFVQSGQPFGPRLAASLLIAYLALDLGYLTGGAGALWLARQRSVRIARLWIIAASVPLMASVALAPQSHSFAMVLTIICLATLGQGWFMSNYFAFATEVSHRHVSTVAGVLGSAGSMAGALFMWLVGYLGKQTGGFQVAFAVLATMPLFAAVGVWIAYGRDTAVNPRLKIDEDAQ